MAPRANEQFWARVSFVSLDGRQGQSNWLLARLVRRPSTHRLKFYCWLLGYCPSSPTILGRVRAASPCRLVGPVRPRGDCDSWRSKTAIVRPP
eukprot:scaffold8628_cov149-Amphora_coffeaeformis.AAC.3